MSKKNIYIVLLVLVLTFLVIQASQAGSKIIMYSPEGRGTPLGDAVYQVTQDFAKSAGVDVSYEVIGWSELKNKLTIGYMGGAVPDVSLILPEWLYDLNNVGMLQPITKEVNSWDEKNAFPDALWHGITIDGEIVAFPYMINPRGLIYRKDLYTKAGISAPPKRWEDLYKIGAKLNSDVNGDGRYEIYGFGYCGAKDPRTPQEFIPYLWQTGGELVKRVNGKWQVGFTAKQAAKVFQFYYDLMFTHKVVPQEAREWGYQQMDMAYASGKIAMSVNGPWMYH
ncbi:MAG: extracellular solute-binding protein [Firmicutes bacterium]|nr:extracellular solute-binding protein [Bacillota bacterium]